jgi:hypothetical protein
MVLLSMFLVFSGVRLPAERDVDCGNLLRIDMI